MRKRLVEWLLTPQLKDEVYKEIWEQGKRKGKATYSVKGKTVAYSWSNGDEVVFSMSYKYATDGKLAKARKKRPPTNTKSNIRGVK